MYFFVVHMFLLGVTMITVNKTTTSEPFLCITKEKDNHDNLPVAHMHNFAQMVKIHETSGKI